MADISLLRGLRLSAPHKCKHVTWFTVPRNATDADIAANYKYILENPCDNCRGRISQTNIRMIREDDWSVARAFAQSRDIPMGEMVSFALREYVERHSDEEAADFIPAEYHGGSILDGEKLDFDSITAKLNAVLDAANAKAKERANAADAD